MSILVYADAHQGKIKKSSLEAVYAAKQIARTQNNSTLICLLYNGNEESKQKVAQAGADKIIHITNTLPYLEDYSAVAKLIKKYVDAEQIKDVVLPHDVQGKAVAAYLAGLLNCGIASAITEIVQINEDTYTFKKNVFSGKAFAQIRMSGIKKIITILPNSFAVQLDSSRTAQIVEVTESTDIPMKVKVLSTEKNTTGDNIPLPEAEIVVSGGRGLKGPENWGIIEDLARALGAATACSRPVADAHWRPHHEHVGQTGLTIRPNLYIAVGISGAIQHLAGVSGSKTIVVINTDKDAPFFKAADYGIVGDAFEVVPKLTEAIKKFKASQQQ